MRHSLFSVSYNVDHWEFRTSTLRCSFLPGWHTGQEETYNFIQVMRTFKLDWKIRFIRKDAASGAKPQAHLTSEEPNILIDFNADSS